MPVNVVRADSAKRAISSLWNQFLHHQSFIDRVTKPSFIGSASDFDNFSGISGLITLKSNVDFLFI